MQLLETIQVAQPVDTVWKFMSDPLSQLKWDRSVAKVDLTSSLPVGVGYTFTTIGPVKDKRPGLRSDYEITEFIPGRHATISLINSRTFKRGDWSFDVEQTPENSTKITCSITFIPWPRYWFVGLVLRFNARAIRRDLHYLQEALQEL